MKEFDVKKFIDFVVDLVNEDEAFYNNEVDSRYYFLHGGCYELYKIVKNYFPDSICLINDKLEHCAIAYGGNIYDAEGIITDKENFHVATQEDIDYMNRKFGLGINSLNSDKIISDIEECNIGGILY